MVNRLLLPFLVAILPLFGAGCGSKGKAVKVEGVVKVDGSAAPGIMVKFVNQDKGGRDADGLTDDNGVFQLTTFNTNDGAVPGTYKVVLSKPSLAAETPKSSGPDESSAVRMTQAMQAFAKSQGPKPGAPKSIVPDVYSKADTTPLKYQIPYDGKIEIEINSKALIIK
jgi:hypothetical protein